MRARTLCETQSPCSSLADHAIGLISLSVLARLLIPAVFGVFALANSMIALLALMGAFRLETALIQNQRAGKAHFDTVFTFNVLLGLAMVIALAALAKPTARFYGDERVVNVVLVLACARLIRAFQNVGDTIGCPDRNTPATKWLTDPLGGLASPAWQP